MTTKSRPLWMSNAACLDKQHLFFDEVKKSLVEQAVAICNGCLVRNECLSHALEHRELGIWGGMTSNQRAKLTRKKRTRSGRSEPTSCSNMPAYGAEEEQ